MANAIASQVQALYVGYLGRAADQAGLDFWTNAIANGTSTIESVALGFTLSQEYTSKYEGLSNEELVAAIYQNVLGRAADADGLAFWVGELEKGVQTPETLLAAMINSLGAVDQKVIDNKVYVANAYTAAAGADYKAEAGAKILEGVDGTAASVAKAIGTLPTSTATLTEGLAGAAAANEALHDFYAGLDLNSDGKADYTEAQTKAAGFDAKADAALNDALSQAAKAAGLIVTSTTTAAQVEAQLSLVEADLEAGLAEDQATLKSLNDTLTAFNGTAAGKGASAAVAANTAAVAAQAAAQKAAAITEAELLAAEARLEKLEDGDVAVTASDVTFTRTGGTAASIATFDAASKSYVLVSGVSDDDYAGVTAYIEALNADYTADQAVIAANAKVSAAQSSIAGINGDPTADSTDAIADLSDLADAIAQANVDIKASEQAIADQEKAEANYRKLVALDEQRDALVKEVEDAEEALGDAGYEVTPVDTDGATAFATSENDAFIFELAGGKDTTIIDFGLQGDDVLFIGADYVLNTGAVATGNDSVFEVFFTQGATAADTNIVIETEAYGSDLPSTVATITLTGVSADQLALVDGYIQVA